MQSDSDFVFHIVKAVHVQESQEASSSHVIYIYIYIGCSRIHTKATSNALFIQKIKTVNNVKRF